MKTKECVINIPAVTLAKQVVGCGNCSGKTVNKFARFKFTPIPAAKVNVMMIKECFANLECKVIDTSLIKRYGICILQVVKAWIDPLKKNPRTLHHRGYGEFAVDGDVIKLSSKMR